MSSQDVCVTICLWLEALTHLNTLKSTYLIPALGALSVMWDHESNTSGQSTNFKQPQSEIISGEDERDKAEGIMC